MKNVREVVDEFGNKVKIEILLNFKIDEYNKEYVVYTLNDDSKSEKVDVVFSEIYLEDGIYKIKSIKEEEINTVLLFYESLKKTLI